MSVSISRPSGDVACPFVCGTIDRVFVVRYHHDLTQNTMAEVFASMLSARRSLGVPLVVVSLVPEHVDGFPRRTDDATENRFEIAKRLCDSMYVVFEGSGFARRVLRGFASLRALTMPIELKSFATPIEALECAARRIERDPRDFVREARERGLVD